MTASKSKFSAAALSVVIIQATKRSKGKMLGETMNKEKGEEKCILLLYPGTTGRPPKLRAFLKNDSSNIFLASYPSALWCHS